MPLHMIDQLMRQTQGITFASIRPYLNGDPLFEDRMPKITEIIRKYSPDSTITIFTNGTNYHKRELLTNPDIGEVHFTISAATPQTYTLVHGLPLWNQAIRTLEWFNEHKHLHQQLWVHFVVTKLNLHELDAWKERFKDYPQWVMSLHHTSRDKHHTQDLVPDVPVVHLNRLKGDLFGMPCTLWNNCTINVHGDYTLCCNAPVDYTFGNIADTPLFTAWKRRLDNKMQNEYCQSCNVRAKNWRELLNAS
jgi:hypothetical protein